MMCEKLKAGAGWLAGGLLAVMVCREESSRRTMVIQMLPHFHIPMPSGGNVEISLHLVPLQTPIHPTALKRLPPLPSRRLLKFPLPPSPNFS